MSKIFSFQRDENEWVLSEDLEQGLGKSAQSFSKTSHQDLGQ